MVYRNLGVERVLLANEIYDETAIAWLAAQDFCTCSSTPTPRAASRCWPGRASASWSNWGHPGGRTGCRTLEEAKALKALIDATDGVEFAGCPATRAPSPTATASPAIWKDLRRLAEDLDAPIVSAGGSSYFDLVTDELAGMDAQVIVRPGAYIGHDEGFYAPDEPLRRPAEARS